MCVIIACRTRWPSPRILRQCEEANPHGGGLAWLNSKTGRVSFVKGLDHEAVAHLIESGEVELPAVIHFRITTAGSTCAELCHPFPVEPNSRLDLSGSAERVLFHNGHWRGWHDHHGTLQGKCSDTRVMAHLASSGTCPEEVEMICESFVEEGGAGRIATLGEEGILLFGKWVAKEGLAFSNTYWVTNRRY